MCDAQAFQQHTPGGANAALLPKGTDSPSFPPAKRPLPLGAAVLTPASVAPLAGAKAVTGLEKAAVKLVGAVAAAGAGPVEPNAALVPPRAGDPKLGISGVAAAEEAAPPPLAPPKEKPNAPADELAAGAAAKPPPLLAPDEAAAPKRKGALSNRLCTGVAVAPVPAALEAGPNAGTLPFARPSVPVLLTDAAWSGRSLAANSLAPAATLAGKPVEMAGVPKNLGAAAGVANALPDAGENEIRPVRADVRAVADTPPKDRPVVVSPMTGDASGADVCCGGAPALIIARCACNGAAAASRAPVRSMWTSVEA